MNLDDLRRQLTQVDRRILDLVAERQAVVQRIGEFKLGGGHPTRDFAREKRVIDTAREHAGELAIAPDLAESLMQLLIQWSLTDQEQARVRAEGHGSGRRALIIGGAGKMGTWFAEFLDSQGFDVTVADPTPVDRFDRVADWRETDDHFDVTVVAAPIGITATILQDLARTPRGGLIFDIGSLKSPLVEGLTALAQQGALVTSLHPMFGPDTELLSGRHVLFLEAGVPAATAQARALFASTMARQIEMQLADHDRMIAYVLGLSHALNIAFFSALAESGEEIPELANLSSTTFDAQLEVAQRVAQESPELYFEIQTQNPHGLDPLHKLSAAVGQISRIVADGDQAAFVQLMERGRAYLATRE